MPLPEWLTEPVPQSPRPETRRGSWLAKAIVRLASLAAAHEHQPGLLRLDPRAALPGFIALIVCATFLHHPFSLLVCWIISIALATAVGSPARTLAAASAAVGLLTAAVMLPGTLSAVTPGAPVLRIAGLTMTTLGLHILAVVLLRSLACLTLGIGLFSSNRAEDLFAALRSFRVPGIFVAILLVTYRYLQVIVRVALESHVARKSRVAEETSLPAARQWLGERVGSLYARSRRLGEEVHLAMLARGFDGEWLPRPTSRLGVKDFGWVCMCFIGAAALIVLDIKVAI